MPKPQLRSEIKARLAHIDQVQRDEKSKRIRDLVVSSETFRDASVIMMFLSMPHEVDTTSMILHAWRQGKTIVVPKVSWQQRHMIPVEIKSLETGLATNGHGLRNPTEGEPVPFEDIDLIITPGLAFDRNGNRLGRGGGYYDKFFATHEKETTKWAVAFSEQLVDKVPTADDDIPVDAVVTENEIIHCNRK